MGTPALAQTTGDGAEGAKRSPFEMALGLPDNVSVSGSIRPRYESIGNSFVAGSTGSDHLLGLRTHLEAEIDLGSLKLVGELADSRWIDGDAGGEGAGEIDTLEPSQFFAAWTFDNALAAGAKLEARAGRFTLDEGSRRLVARANFRSTLQSFDGVRMAWTRADDLHVTAFYVVPTRRDPSDAASARDNEAAVNGVRVEGLRFSMLRVDAPLPHGLRGEAFIFGLDERDTSDTDSRNRELTTVGARLRKAPDAAAFDFDLEFAHQTGNVRASTSPLDVTDLDHEAQMLHLEGGYSFETWMSPRVSVHYDHATGDENPLDGESGRFDARDFGIVRDDLRATQDVLRQAAVESDLIITSGGVSAGEGDHVKPAVQAVGEHKMWKIALKPGKPLAYGHVRNEGAGAAFIGLPGNPVSALVTFVVVVRPFILRLKGAARVLPYSEQRVADFDLPKVDPRREFLRAKVGKSGRLQLFPNQSSAVLTSAVWADGLIDNPPANPFRRGDSVRFLPFHGLLY